MHRLIIKTIISLNLRKYKKNLLRLSVLFLGIVLTSSLTGGCLCDEDSGEDSVLINEQNNEQDDAQNDQQDDGQSIDQGSTEKANLSMISLSTPRTGFGEDNGGTDEFSIAVVFENNGNINAEDFRVGYYLSSDINWDSNDILIASSLIQNLSAGFFTIASGQIMIPSGIEYGYYYVLAVADDDGFVTESDETDNVVYRDLVRINSMITGQSDLISYNFNTFSDHSFSTDSSIPISFSSMNNSNTPIDINFYIGIYLSNDYEITTDDELIAESDTAVISDFTTSPLQGGGGVIVEGYVEINSISAGLYYLGGFSDNTDLVNECDECENNNTHSWPIVIIDEKDIGKSCDLDNKRTDESKTIEKIERNSLGEIIYYKIVEEH